MMIVPIRSSSSQKKKKVTMMRTRGSQRQHNRLAHYFFLVLAIWMFLVLPYHQVESSLGGEKLAYATLPFTTPTNEDDDSSNTNSTTKNNNTHRQNICDRYMAVHQGEIPLRYALRGLELRPILSNDEFFNYDYETGIDKEDPGMLGNLMDDLASRAEFTWRQSFGVMEPPESLNVTWTDALLWAVETYDIAINWWDHSVERMEKGVAYTIPFFDGSIILIDKPNDSTVKSTSSEEEDDKKSDNKLAIWNWTRPFTYDVWILIIFTITLSAFVFQLIEHISGIRDGRSIWQWTGDNLYLSWLNATQQYEYAPGCAASRIYGISMSIWALVMTATYTANLASLLVKHQTLTNSNQIKIETMEDAIKYDQRICTWGSTNSDIVIENRWPHAKRLGLATEIEGYQALENGNCDILAAYKDNWLGHQSDSRYNPSCQMEWVGRVVEVIQSGFALKADAGIYCTSLIRDVLNLHMAELIQDGALEHIWTKHRSNIDSRYAQTCNGDYDSTNIVDDNDNDDEKNRIRSRRRRLGGNGGNAAAASTSSSTITAGGVTKSASLTLTEMAGTFILHYISMFAAILVAIIHNFVHQRQLKAATKKLQQTSSGETNNMDGQQEVRSVEFVRTRPHGPIIGSPPPVNTYRSIGTITREETCSTTSVGSSGSCSYGKSSIGKYVSSRNFRRDRMETPIAVNPTTTTNDRRIAFRDHIKYMSEVKESTREDQDPSRQSILVHNAPTNKEFQKLQQDNQMLKSQQQELSNQMDMMLELLQNMKNEQQQQTQVQPSSTTNDSAVLDVLYEDLN